MAFSGTFDYTLDVKNRLTVPSKYRSAFSTSVVLAKGTERCVAIWDPDEFSTYVKAALEGLHPLSPRADKVNRFFRSNSIDVTIDSANRVMIPNFLMQHAGLDKEVVVTGVGDRLEVWDRATWAEYNSALDITEITSAFDHPA
jgi:transcriptional regulator MraZ